MKKFIAILVAAISLLSIKIPAFASLKLPILDGSGKIIREPTWCETYLGIEINWFDICKPGIQGRVLGFLTSFIFLCLLIFFIVNVIRSAYDLIRNSNDKEKKKESILNIITWFSLIFGLFALFFVMNLILGFFAITNF